MSSDLAMIFLPSSTLVPSSRTTSGTCRPTSFTAATTPSAMTSHLHDAAEDVDQDALHVGIGGDDLERRRHLLLGGAAADVEEIRRRLAVELDDVHGRHGQAGAVDHAADGAVERDVVEIVAARLRSPWRPPRSRSRSAAISGWRNSALSSKPTLASRQISSPALVTTSGLISSRLMSLATKRLIELRQHALGLLGEVAAQAQRLRDARRA